MLQQTQVATVLRYYARFLERFPDVTSLAQARDDDVMAYWAGLGYYSRARNLHRAAQQVVSRHGGRFPADVTLLADLPGVGRSTAAAIAAFAYDVIAPILDGNVKRVLARHAAVEGYPGVSAVEKKLWSEAAMRLPTAASDMVAYTQGLMDLGATICAQRSALSPLPDRSRLRRANQRSHQRNSGSATEQSDATTLAALLAIDPRRQDFAGQTSGPGHLGRALVFAGNRR